MKIPDTLHGIRIAVILAVLIGSILCTMHGMADTITDDAGNPVSINGTPTRIVSLAPSNTEIVAALGLTDRLVGVTDVCDYPREVTSIRKIGGYSSISIEKVAAAQPDLILASDITPQATVDRLRSLGLTVCVVSPRNIDHMVRDIRMVGTLTGTRARADELAGSLSGRLTALAPCTQSSERPTVAHVVWHDPLYVSGNDTLQNDVIEHAGGVNVFAEKSGWYTVSLEELLMKNPDVIIVNGGEGMDSSENDIILTAFMNNPQYSSLSAVKNHRIYAVDANIISRPAPRIVNATEEVVHLLHPGCFTSAAISPGTPSTTVRSSGPFVVCGISLVITGILMGRRWAD